MKAEVLQWFEQTFESVSGEDQLLQLDEFKRALYTSGVSVGVHRLEHRQRKRGDIVHPQYPA